MDHCASCLQSLWSKILWNGTGTKPTALFYPLHHPNCSEQSLQPCFSHYAILTAQNKAFSLFYPLRHPNCSFSKSTLGKRQNCPRHLKAFPSLFILSWSEVGVKEHWWQQFVMEDQMCWTEGHWRQQVVMEYQKHPTTFFTPGSPPLLLIS